MVLTVPGFHEVILVRAKDLYFFASSNSVQGPSPPDPWTVHGGLEHKKNNPKVNLPEINMFV